MTWPFENDTSAITKKLAKKSLQSEKRRNLMVVIAVALASCLICFSCQCVEHYFLLFRNLKIIWPLFKPAMII